MDIATIIEYVFTLTLVVYLLAAALVWIFEFKKNALYGEMQKQTKFLESLHISSALRHIKLYKIREDCRRATEPLEKLQQSILQNVLFSARQSSQKEKSLHV